MPNQRLEDLKKTKQLLEDREATLGKIAMEKCRTYRTFISGRDVNFDDYLHDPNGRSGCRTASVKHIEALNLLHANIKEQLDIVSNETSKPGI